MTAGGTPLARLDGARLGYGGRIVFDGVTLNLRAGERLVFLGPSGAGKSTLLGALYARLQGRVALVPQEAGLVPQLSVAKNVYMGRLDDFGAARNLAALVRLPGAAAGEISAVLEEVGLGALMARRVEELSGGQKQRTALARALYRGGAVLLADEPVSAVDEAQAAALLAALGARFGTCVLALHDLDLARGFATRLVGVRAGTVQFDAAPEAVSDDMIGRLYAA